MIQVQIGQPVPIKNKPKLMYELVVKSMHGDADLYTTQTSMCESEDELVSMLKVLAASFTAGDDNGEIIEAITAVDFAYGDVCDFYGDIVGYDKTYDSGDYATLEKVEVFWYDASGVKHDCKINNMKMSRW
jgi:hypothetical protein